jgi:hypothetical protein
VKQLNSINTSIFNNLKNSEAKTGQGRCAHANGFSKCCWDSVDLPVIFVLLWKTKFLFFIFLCTKIEESFKLLKT